MHTIPGPAYSVVESFLFDLVWLYSVLNSIELCCFVQMELQIVDWMSPQKHTDWPKKRNNQFVATKETKYIFLDTEPVLEYAIRIWLLWTIIMKTEEGRSFCGSDIDVMLMEAIDKDRSLG